MEVPEYQTLDHLDPLDVMMEDRDILGLIDPEETAEMLQSLQDVLEKDIDMAPDPDDVNNNNIVLTSSTACASTSKPELGVSVCPMEHESSKEDCSQAKQNSSSPVPPNPSTDTQIEKETTKEDAKGTDNPEEKTDDGLRRSARQIEYNLRTSSILNRIETEQRRKMPKMPKPKNKPPPLSKYRRKTANSRERQRMQEINDAFVELQNAIPDLPSGNAKLTKITTLRLALNYIASLRELLGYGDPLGLEWSSPAPGRQSDQCTSPSGASSTASTDCAAQSPPTSATDSDGMSVSTCSPGQRSGLDSEGESSYSS